MRPDTIAHFIDLCGPEHDRMCNYGADCPERREHIENAYLARRMAMEIETQAARVRELERIVATVDNLLTWVEKQPDRQIYVADLEAALTSGPTP